jgi:hypothetical protein
MQKYNLLVGPGVKYSLAAPLSRIKHKPLVPGLATWTGGKLQAASNKQKGKNVRNFYNFY